VTNSMAAASRPGTPGKFEIEAADDFFVGAAGARINSGTFTGLIVPSGTSAPTIGEVVVELYNIFPVDSNTVRTITVPTRTNSPSDVDFASRDSSAGTLTFGTTILSTGFAALNSITAGGIHPAPMNVTGGNGAVTGTEVQFNIAFSNSFELAQGHYFFIPQVQVTGGDFYWLSASRPIDATGTPFPAGVTDLQSWTRDANLDPDWLRIGTDIVGVGAFNQAFTLSGVVPEPPTWSLMAAGLAVIALLRHVAGAVRWGRRRS
jgi:hypothetical protein